MTFSEETNTSLFAMTYFSPLSGNALCQAPTATEIRKYHPNKVILCSALPVCPGAFQTQHQLLKEQGILYQGQDGCSLDHQHLQASIVPPLQKKPSPKWKAELGVIPEGSKGHGIPYSTMWMN